MAGEDLATREQAERDSEPRSTASSSSRGRARRSPALDGRYHALLLAGRGGMGTVEIALERDEASGFRRIVALKRLLPDGARDRRHAEMFLREAKVAALLAHDNIVRAFDSGEADGELYIAMEYVEGQPLSRVLSALARAGETLDAELVSFVLAEVCDGLHAAHELEDDEGGHLNLVHRDVSPQNVMVSYDGAVKLLDFGVAKIQTESVTKTGEVKGKTAYMSPEQAMGDALDRRSDLFGVGAMLFECLTLERMWGDGTDMEVIRKLALEAPPSLRERVPDAPEALVALYDRLVAKERDDRPGTALEVSKALRDVAAGKTADAARAELRALMERQFGEISRARRTELTRALDAVEGAAELRESFTPSDLPDAPSSSRRGAAPKSAIVKEAATEEAARATAPAEDAPRARWPLVAVALLAAGGVAWFATRTAPADPGEGAGANVSPTATATANPTASPTATATANPTANPTATATANPTASPTATATANPAAEPRATSTTTGARVAPRVTAAPRVVPAATSASARAPVKPPAPSSTVPLNVDEKPF